MRRANWLMVFGFALAFAGLFASRAAAAGPNSPQYIPNDKTFWDDSKNWTTNFGPAYRDTVEDATQMLGCTGEFALCFHSGAAPFPCRLSADGQSADCKCTVQSSTNYVLETAILNYDVYLKTLKTCGADGTDCPDPDDAPVCGKLKNGRLIPGANVISTF